MLSVAPDDTRAVLALLIDAAHAAGATALESFRFGAPTAARVAYKHGGSPVTDADLAADAYLRETLGRAVPGAAWLSEETADDLRRLDFRHVLVADPIDGTRSYCAGDPAWSVAVALVTDGRPVAGVVHAPALGKTWAAVRGGGARLNGASIGVTTPPALAGVRLAAPAGFIQPFTRANTVELVPKIGSLACRFATVAEGSIDVAIASPNAHDWDIAAVDLILHEAGGVLSAGDGLPRIYNRRTPRHPTLYGSGAGVHPALLAAGRRTLAGGA